MTDEVSAGVDTRAVSASTGARAVSGAAGLSSAAPAVSSRAVAAVASRDPSLLNAIVRAVTSALGRDPATANANTRLIAAQIAQDMLDQYLIDRVLSCEPGAQRNRVHVRQLWNAGFKDVIGNDTTYFTAEAVDREIDRGEFVGMEFRGSGCIDLEVDGELDVVTPEPALTITHSLQTSPLPYAAPEVWTTIASWTQSADPTIGSAPRRFYTRARLRARGSTGSVQKHTLTAWTFCDPVTDPPGFEERVAYNGNLAVPWDTRWSSALRIVSRIDGTPSASRRSTVFGSFAALWPRDPDGY